ncbi:MAG: polyisoprenoid-binding protein [Microbacteriaceae bacterium]|jgi:polyisoprenoid-binding protein YceI|nr:polyisoprenoid-binding protein [Microbacteriaceae bacterium]HEV7956841.1 YceI family protein [Marisediminicola sp.]
MAITAETIPGYVAGTWALDAAHSEVTFSVRHLAISKVRGSFEKFDVTVVTGENPMDTRLTASVDVASVNTKQKDRDNHLRTSDFFQVDEYPTIDFVSTGVRESGDKLLLDGELTMRGVTKPVTFAGEFGGIIVNGYGQTVAGASFSTKINRHDFGVSWNAAVEAGGLTLGEEVSITIDAQVALQQ